MMLTNHAYAFDVKGLQPIAPYGVFSVFSAESLDKGSYSFGVEAEKSEETDFYRYTLQSAYGITDNIEFINTIPYVSKYENRVSGWEDFAFGVKHRIYEGKKYEPSVAYILNASLGAGKNDFSTNGRLGAGLVLSKKVGPVNGHANLFFQKAGDHEYGDEVDFAAGFDFSASNNVKLLAELYSRKVEGTGRKDKLEWRLGYRFVSNENIFTTIGVGADFKSRNPEYRIMFSVSMVLPQKETPVKTVYEEEK